MPLLLLKILFEREVMRECKFFQSDCGDCWIDFPDSSYPCICKGDLDNCPHIGLDGKPLKDGDFCIVKD